MENLNKSSHNNFSVSRKRMINEQLIKRGITDRKVLRIMGALPRHIFVDEALQDQAYRDYPVGIGEGQTISQPYTVALMTETLNLKGHEKVLEIGTGCGYQTAVLASLVNQVYTIERIKNLGLKARAHLRELGLKNIVMRIGDGTQGWVDQAPFDCILTAAASPIIPQPLVDQLAEGGKLVLPIGQNDKNQNLLRITKVGDSTEVEDLGPCRFVKLIGQHGWGRQRQAGEQFKKRSVVD